MATHSNILARRIPWTEEPRGAKVHEVAESETEQLTYFTYYLGQGRGVKKFQCVLRKPSFLNNLIIWLKHTLLEAMRDAK